MTAEIELELGDCLDILDKQSAESFDLAYLDPPFYTQKTQRLKTRERDKEFSFSDTWKSREEYAEFLKDRLVAIHSKLKTTGSIFFHCDRNASHVARLLLDEVFGIDQFRAEIIWYYRRWSSGNRNLLPAHQNILFYSKTDEYKFNVIRQEYSPSTNIDQILQRRTRDQHGKSVYDVDEDGSFVPSGEKSGVPLGDVWDIPYLNPKAKERTGYPTQKPILLLERIIELVTDAGDHVLDPFCGSGTTLVAASLMKRTGLGIDRSSDALDLCRQRLNSPVKTESPLLASGRNSYDKVDERVRALLSGLDYVPVHRNKGIDAFINVPHDKCLIPVKLQREGESLDEAVNALSHAGRKKKARKMLLIADLCSDDELEKYKNSIPADVIVVPSLASRIKKSLSL